MNIFRLAGDMTHVSLKDAVEAGQQCSREAPQSRDARAPLALMQLLSIMVLLLKIRATRSCRGE